MHKLIPSMSAEEYAQQVMERRATLRTLVALPAQPASREVREHRLLRREPGALAENAIGSELRCRSSVGSWACAGVVDSRS